MAQYNGQLLRKFDDTASGNALASGRVEVFNTGTVTQASLFSDADLTTPLANPFNADDNGFYTFFVEDGYYDLLLGDAEGSTTVTNVQIGNPDTFLNGAPLLTTNLFSPNNPPNEKWFSRGANPPDYTFRQFPEVANSYILQTFAPAPSIQPVTNSDVVTTGATFSGTFTEIYAAASVDGSNIVYWTNANNLEIIWSNDGGATFQSNTLTIVGSSGIASIIPDPTTDSQLVLVTVNGDIGQLTLGGSFFAPVSFVSRFNFQPTNTITIGKTAAFFDNTYYTVDDSLNMLYSVNGTDGTLTTTTVTNADTSKGFDIIFIDIFGWIHLHQPGDARLHSSNDLFSTITVATLQADDIDDIEDVFAFPRANLFYATSTDIYEFNVADDTHTSRLSIQSGQDRAYFSGRNFASVGNGSDPTSPFTVSPNFLENIFPLIPGESVFEPTGRQWRASTSAGSQYGLLAVSSTGDAVLRVNPAFTGSEPLSPRQITDTPENGLVYYTKGRA